MSEHNLRVASIQLAVSEEGKQSNLDHAAEQIRKIGDVDLIILPELWNIGFMSFDRYKEEAEERDGPTMDLLRQMAVEVDCHLHTGSFVEREGDSFFNSSYLLSPQGEILANYRKVHLFGYQSRETQILSPGDQLAVAETPLGTIGMATCYDLRFPEIFRRMVDMGTELFLVCSAWPYPRLEHWIMLNRVRAVENQAFLVSANSVGPNQGSTFVGHSMVVNPWGVIMASGGDEETTLVVDLDLEEVTRARDKFPALADRTDWLN
jgi:predicted amidohydrolase